MLEILKVVGAVTYHTGEVIQEEKSASSSHIGRKELTRSSSSLGEILAHEAGVQFKQSGGFGSYNSVSIRAASAAQTAVYLDGILLNSGGNPIVDLSILELLNLDSVDIYRGSTPLQLGHGGIGGAVNLNTLDPESAPGTRIRLGLTSFSQTGLQLLHQAKRARWDMVAALSRRHSDNNFSFLNNKGTPLNPDDDQWQKRNNAQATRTSALFRTGFQQHENARTDLTLQLSARELGVPAWLNRADNDASYDTDSGQLQLSQILDGVGSWNSRHSLYWHFNTARFRDVLGRIRLGNHDTVQNTDTLGAKTFWEYPTESGALGTSLEFRHELLDSREHLSSSADFNAHRNFWLGTLHYTWFDANDNWTITPALRWQSDSFSIHRENLNTENLSHSPASNTGAQLGIQYRATSTLSFTGNVGSYYRKASFGELFGSSGLISGNPNLKPEKGINADIGLQYANRSLQINASLFASHRDELIVTAFDTFRAGKPMNSGSAQVSGLELAAQWAASTHLNFRSNLTWQSPRSKDKTDGFYNNFLPGEAQIVWFARALYARNNYSIWYDIDVQKKRFYDFSNIRPAADSIQQSIGIDWKNKQWFATLGLHNLSDTHVEDFSGQPKPGRTWSLSVTRSL